MQTLPREKVRNVLQILRAVPSDTPLEMLQRNEAVLWAVGESFLDDASAQESKIISRLQERQQGYEETIRLLAKILPELDVQYSLVKALRRHPYANTDVNVVVAPKDYERVVDTFIQYGWSIRSIFARTKEWIAERGKRKIRAPRGERLAEVHLYPCATWHGLNYLETQWILQHSTQQQWFGVDVMATDALADLLMHYGHCAFERYSLTFGELYHHQTLRCELGRDGLEEARLATRERGWDVAFGLVDSTVASWWAKDDITMPPVTLSHQELRRSWLARSRYHINRGRMWPALEELIQHQIWSGQVYNVYRWSKRLLGRGRSNLKIIE